jgi:RND superfamily putative drug exporter
MALAGLGAAAMSVGPAPAGDMSIPGTEFQTVIDDLQQAMPDTAGASAGVVFSTSDGKPFTRGQEEAVTSLITQWSATDEIVKTTNPFTTQASSTRRSRRSPTHEPEVSNAEPADRGRTPLRAA